MATESLKDIKLSVFNQRNNLNKEPDGNKKRCRFSFFIVYTAFILGITLMVSISPKTAKIIVEAIVKFCRKTAQLPEPLRSLVYMGILYLHQFTGLPLQTVSAMLITFSLQEFWHGYLLSLIVNISTGLIFYLLFKKCLRKRMETKYKDNLLVLVIKEEAAAHPIRVSFFFRFMNIPGLYKNVGLGLSEKISFLWYSIPMVLETIISSGVVCFLGAAMEEGLDVLNPKAVAEKNRRTRIIFAVSYALLAVQVICIGLGLLLLILKAKKLRQLKREVEFRKWREQNDPKGYVHDLHENEQKKITDDHQIHVFDPHLSTDDADDELPDEKVNLETPKVNELTNTLTFPYASTSQNTLNPLEATEKISHERAIQPKSRFPKLPPLTVNTA